MNCGKNANELIGDFASAESSPIADGPIVDRIAIAVPIKGSKMSSKISTRLNRLAAIIDSSEDAIIGKDLDGIITDWNAGARRLYGYSVNEVIGKPISILMPAEQANDFPEIMQRIRRGERVSHYETVRQRKDGSRVDVSLSVSPIRDCAGEIVGAAAIARDISERKRQEAALRESEERFHLICDVAPALIWMSGVDNLRTYFNAAWLDFTGRPIDEELGNGWVDNVHAEDMKRCLETYTEAFDRREKFRMEYRLRRSDGEYRWLLDIGVPRFDRHNSFLGYI